MKLKKSILSIMGNDSLKAVIDDLEIAGIDRRSNEAMRKKLSRARSASPALLLRRLGAREVKQVIDSTMQALGMSGAG